MFQSGKGESFAEAPLEINFKIKNPPGPRLGAVTKGIPYYTKAFLYSIIEFLTTQRDSLHETSKTLLFLHEI